MRKGLMVMGLVVALAGGQATAGDGWWTDSTETMPSLVGQGFEVVGYATYKGASGLGGSDMTFIRYVLQKGTSVFQCTENLLATPMGRKATTACQVLAAPGG